VDHRAKNLLAVVQSLIKLTPFHDRDQYAAALEGRIQALARVQSLLSQTRWKGALLEELVKRELAAHIHNQPDRLQIAGPNLLVQAELLHPLSMALHELATNAAKYGALSVDGGVVTVEWGLEGDNLRIAWREAGGPRLDEPNMLGFGSQLLRAAARQAGGSAHKNWHPDGLQCILVFPAKHVRETKRSSQANEACSTADPRQLVGKRVLVVEDEALIGFELERTLTRAGATVVGPILDHRQAMQLAKGEQFDCALLDANLGGISSEDICRTIERRGLPFLLLTGYERPGFPAHWPMLRKPARDQELTAALCAALCGAASHEPEPTPLQEVREG
jgi:two-component sensor histidine kinase/ActR/RegA family two-component response regulator